MIHVGFHPTRHVLGYANFIDLRVRSPFGRQCQYPFPFLCVQKLPIGPQQFERVPLFGVVAGRENNSTGRSFCGHREFNRRRCAQSQIQYVDSHGVEGTNQAVPNHFTTQARIPADHNGWTGFAGSSLDPSGVTRPEPDNILGSKPRSFFSADRTTNP